MTVEAASQGRAPGSSIRAIALCFALSGFAGLIYETVWLRELSLVFGTSEPAVATVLAVYMAGLAIGSAAAARLVGRVTRPVLVYGLLELAVGASALAVPVLLLGARAAHARLLGGRPDPPDAGGVATALFYLACSLPILLVPTACMGATLPLLARHAVHRERDIGARIGALYAVNTAGAVAGTLATALYLLPALGLRGTLAVGAALNVGIFAVAAAIARRTAPLTRDVSAAGAPRRAPAAPRPGGARPTSLNLATVRAEDRWPRAAWAAPIMLGSGAAALTYEVLWTRLLGYLLGSSVVAFATMLASFLAGIAIGSAVAGRFARTRRRAAAGLAAAQIGAAALSALAYGALDLLSAFAHALGAGEPAGAAANLLLASTVLLPASLCLGAAFPCAVRVLARDERDAGRASARVYAWNTAGAIAGALGAGFILVPALGFAGTVRLAAGVNLLLAVAAILVPPRPAPRVGLFGAAAAVAVLLILMPDRPDRLLRHSPLLRRIEAGTLIEVGVGRSATVTVLERNGRFLLRVDGMPEAEIAPRGAPPPVEWARWLSALPALARPEARSVLIVGLGGGATVSGVPPKENGRAGAGEGARGSNARGSGDAPGAGVGSVDVIEIEPEVVAANRAIAARRLDDPLADPRVRLIINDARGALALTTCRYDLIVSQPSHPWAAGASHLYTREFLALARAHLTPGGVFVQWMNSRFLDEPLFRTLGATLLDTFRHVRLYSPYPDMLIFLASDEPLDPEGGLERIDGETEAATARAVRDHYGRLGIAAREDVAAALLLDTEGLAALCAAAPINTDDHNRLETGARRALGHGLGPEGTWRLVRDHATLMREAGAGAVAPASALDLPAVVARLEAMGTPERADDVTAAIHDPADRALGAALLARARGGADAPGETEGAFRAVLALRPDDQDALFALLELREAAVAVGAGETAPEIEPEAAGLRDPAAATHRAARLARRGAWAQVARLDDVLARTRPTDVWSAEAARLRAAWRTAPGPAGVDADAAAKGMEAMEIIDRALAREPGLPLLLGRLDAAVRSGAPHAVLETAAAIAASLEIEDAPPEPARAAAARALAALTLATGVDPTRRRAVEASLRAVAESPGKHRAADGKEPGPDPKNGS